MKIHRVSYHTFTGAAKASTSASNRVCCEFTPLPLVASGNLFEHQHLKSYLFLKLVSISCQKWPTDFFFFRSTLFDPLPKLLLISFHHIISHYSCYTSLISPFAGTYHETVKLLEECLHLSHQLPQLLGKAEWRLGASLPNCDQSKEKRSGSVILSCALSESHRSSQSAAIDKDALANLLSVQRVLF